MRAISCRTRLSCRPRTSDGAPNCEEPRLEGNLKGNLGATWGPIWGLFKPAFLSLTPRRADPSSGPHPGESNRLP